MEVRPSDGRDGPWAREMLLVAWGSTSVVLRDRLIDASTLPGFVAQEGDRRLGFVTYQIEGHSCEVVTINSLVSGRGIGRALMDAVREVAAKAGCRCLRLITTNDNTVAMRFYQRYGFELVALHRNAIEEYRRLKPEIPQRRIDGIPLLHALDFELTL
jgi:ribosomal protein S18 acetylase RimI-like enzyme